MNSTTIRCDSMNDLIKQRVSAERDGYNTEVKGKRKGRGDEITYYLIVSEKDDKDELMKDHLYSELNEK